MKKDDCFSFELVLSLYSSPSLTTFQLLLYFSNFGITTSTLACLWAVCVCVRGGPSVTIPQHVNHVNLYSSFLLLCNNLLKFVLFHNPLPMLTQNIHVLVSGVHSDPKLPARMLHRPLVLLQNFQSSHCTNSIS